MALEYFCQPQEPGLRVPTHPTDVLDMAETCVQPMSRQSEIPGQSLGGFASARGCSRALVCMLVCVRLCS